MIFSAKKTALRVSPPTALPGRLRLSPAGKDPISAGERRRVEGEMMPEKLDSSIVLLRERIERGDARLRRSHFG